MLRKRFEVVVSSMLLVATLIILLLVSGDFALPNFTFGQASAANLAELHQNTEETQSLNSADAARYHESFLLQHESKWKEANELIAEIDNPLLMGHLLAERYLHRDYKSSKDELAEWLQYYSDHPQARRIYQVARAKGVHAPLPREAKRQLNGFGESFKNLRHKSPRIAGSWKSALKYWRKGEYEKAYRIFASLEETMQTMDDWDRAAISFWAYRAANALKKDDKAQQHLQVAAQFPRSFYGAQAVYLLGETLDDTIALRGEGDLEDYLDKVESADTRNALRRIEGLLKVEQPAIAREELLMQYAQAEVKDRVAFVPLAQALNLPALQLRMGVDMDRRGVTSGQALYPLPQWEPKDGYTVDPALVFAVARQESGFNAKARSYAGAQGAMQLMPDTAKYIAGKMNENHELELNDPINSITLGQHYLNYLANKPYIQGNVVLLAAAYNAGPANAKRWAKRPSMVQDPLYFIETLPFSETRDYVMNVMTNYWMYREIIDDDDPGVTLFSQGKWPMMAPAKSEVADSHFTWPLQSRS